MTTPDRTGAPEDLGLIELFGEPSSPFVRTVSLALTELNIHYIAIARSSHSDEIKSRNPYGLTPVLVHRPDGLYTRPEDVITLSEGSIRRYVDELLAPLSSTHRHLTPPLRSSAGVVDAKIVVLRSKLDGLISKLSQTIIPTLDAGYIKPASALAKQGKDAETINSTLAEPLTRIHTLLEIVEGQAAKNAKWLLEGEDLTWADLFLFPVLDDLRSSPAGHFVSGSSPNFAWLSGWLGRMDERVCVKVGKKA